jgi:hypothetical protein
VISGLNLSDAQQKQIRTTVQEYRNRLVDLRATVEKADGDLNDVFNDTTIDQRKANDAINRLANARGELTKVLSQMTLKLRTVLTNEQWQELQRRERERGGPRGLGIDGAPGPDPGAGSGRGFRRRNPGFPPEGPGGPPPNPQGAPAAAQPKPAVQ